MEYNFRLQRFAEEGAGEPDDTQASQNDEKTPEFTQEQQDYINRIVAGRLAKERAKAARDADKKAESEKLKAMTESERQAKELQDALAELKQARAEKEKADMISAARSSLKEKGYDFSDSMLTHLIADSAEETRMRLDAFVADFEKALDAKVKAAVQPTSPRTGVRSAAKLTKKEIMAVKNRSERQKLIKENMELFR